MINILETKKRSVIIIWRHLKARREMMERAVNRWQSPAKSTALLAWIEYMEQLANDKNHQALEDAAEIQKHELMSLVQAEKARRISQAQRILKRMLKSYLPVAWYSFVGRTRALQEKRLACQRVVQRLVHTHLAAAFDHFIEAIQEQKTQQQRIERAMARWRAPVLEFAFRAWTAQFEDSKELLHAAAQQNAMLELKRSLEYERDTIHARVQQECDRRIQMSARVVQRMGHIQLACTFDAYRDRVAEVREKRLGAQRVILRMSKTHLAVAFDMFVQAICQIQEHRKQAEGQAQAQQALDELAENCKYVAGLREAVSLLENQNGDLAADIRQQREKCDRDSERRMASAASKVLLRWRGHRLCAAMVVWKQQTHDRMRLRRAANKAVQRWRGAALGGPLAWWRESASEGRRLRRMGAKVVTRWRCQAKRVALAVWVERSVEARRLRRGGTKAVARWRHRAMANACWLWREYANTEKQLHVDRSCDMIRENLDLALSAIEKLFPQSDDLEVAFQHTAVPPSMQRPSIHRAAAPPRRAFRYKEALPQQSSFALELGRGAMHSGMKPMRLVQRSIFIKNVLMQGMHTRAWAKMVADSYIRFHVRRRLHQIVLSWFSFAVQRLACFRRESTSLQRRAMNCKKKAFECWVEVSHQVLMSKLHEIKLAFNSMSGGISNLKAQLLLLEPHVSDGERNPQRKPQKEICGKITTAVASDLLQDLDEIITSVARLQSSNKGLEDRVDMHEKALQELREAAEVKSALAAEFRVRLSGSEKQLKAVEEMAQSINASLLIVCTQLPDMLLEQAVSFDLIENEALQQVKLRVHSDKMMSMGQSMAVQWIQTLTRTVEEIDVQLQAGHAKSTSLKGTVQHLETENASMRKRVEILQAREDMAHKNILVERADKHNMQLNLDAQLLDFRCALEKEESRRNELSERALKRMRRSRLSQAWNSFVGCIHEFIRNRSIAKGVFHRMMRRKLVEIFGIFVVVTTNLRLRRGHIHFLNTQQGRQVVRWAFDAFLRGVLAAAREKALESAFAEEERLTRQVEALVLNEITLQASHEAQVGKIELQMKELRADNRLKGLRVEACESAVDATVVRLQGLANIETAMTRSLEQIMNLRARVMQLETEKYTLNNKWHRAAGHERDVASLRHRVQELQTREEDVQKKMLGLHSDKRALERQLAEALEANRRALVNVRLLAEDKVELEQEILVMKEIAGRPRVHDVALENEPAQNKVGECDNELTGGRRMLAEGASSLGTEDIEALDATAVIDHIDAPSNAKTTERERSLLIERVEALHGSLTQRADKFRPSTPRLGAWKSMLDREGGQGDVSCHGLEEESGDERERALRAAIRVRASLTCKD